MIKDTKVYIILYKKDKGRVFNITNNVIPKLEEHGIPYQIIDAIDGHTNHFREFLKKDNSVVIKPDLHKWKWAIRGQVACTLSHICAWREIKKNNDKYAIVLEDDCSIESSFNEDINNINSELPENFNFCYLYMTPKKYKNDISVQIPGLDHLNLPYETFGTVGYMVSQNGVNELLKDFQVVRQEIDQQLLTKINSGWDGVYTSRKVIVQTMGQYTNDNKVTQLRSMVWDSYYFTVYDLKSFVITSPELDQEHRKTINEDLNKHLFNYQNISATTESEVLEFVNNVNNNANTNNANTNNADALNNVRRNLSHLKAWNRCLELGLESCCVLESNSKADHYFTMNSDRVRLEMPDDYHLCDLFISDTDMEAAKNDTNLQIENTLYVCKKSNIHKINSYIISQAGIRHFSKLFENIDNLKLTLDEIIQNEFTNNVNDSNNCKYFSTNKPIIHAVEHIDLEKFYFCDTQSSSDSGSGLAGREMGVDHRPKIGQYVIGEDIDEIVCINLDHRIDRRRAIIEEFKDYPFSFYTAQKHKDPVRGCLESHINVVKYAKEKGYKNIMILEDDLKIVKDLKLVPKFPDNWDMIYLGGLCTHVMEWGEWIRGHIYCDQAYLIHSRLFDRIIEEGWNFDGPLDKYFTSVLHPEYHSYIQRESYIIQTEGWSDIDIKNKWKNFKWPCVGEMFPIP